MLKLFEAGEPVLRQASRELSRDEILSAATQDLIASMYETMRAAPGVGLAAPQIGLPLQVAVIEDRQEYLANLSTDAVADRRREPVPAHVIINPRITYISEDGEASDAVPDGDAVFFEGCLSLPGFTAMVPRSLRVRVECLNEHADPVAIEARGWYARILQHEIDHLRGTMYIDRMLSRTFMGRENFERHWKDIPVSEARRRLRA
jgi:peptide deformylase